MENLKKEGFELPVANIVLFDNADIVTLSENEGPFVPADIDETTE